MRIVSAAVLLVLGAAAVPVHAQTALRAGPLAGISIAKFSGDDVGDVDNHASFAVGGFVEIEFSPNLALEPQLLYIRKGVGDPDSDAELRLDYLELPVLLKSEFPLAGRTPVTPGVFVGPYVAYRVACQEYDGDNTTDCAADTFKKFDAGAVAGAGVEIGPVSLQVRYDWGLTHLDDTGLDLDGKNRAVVITVGYGFTLR